MKTIILFALMLCTLLLPLPTSSQVVSCAIQAAINNQDIKTTTDASGTNIRSGAGTNFEIVKTLHSDTGILFFIDGNQGSWFRIERYCVGGPSFGECPTLRGWIYAPSTFIKFGYGDGDDPSPPIYSLFAQPSLKSTKIKKLQKNDVAPLAGCNGTWAKITYGGTSGWIPDRTQCTDLWGRCD